MWSRVRRTAGRWAAAAVVVVGAAGGLAGRLGAQSTPSALDGTPGARSASRATLTAALQSAERRGDATAASAIRRRLTQGDVRPGDRLLVTLTLDSVARGEFVVRDSQFVEVPPFGRLSLRGVLRSELPAAFRRFYLQYYRNPEVRVQTLIRVGFLGAVQKPGYYPVPPDVPVAETFAAVAGGPAGNADPKKLEVKRGSTRLYDRRAYERVAREGLTFDEAGIQSGDELRIGERKSRNTGQIIQVALLVLSTFTSLVFLTRTISN